MLHPHDMSLHISSDHFEKLGVFYLSRGYDLEVGKVRSRSLRALLLMGEIFGYFPPVTMAPSNCGTWFLGRL